MTANSGSNDLNSSPEVSLGSPSTDIALLSTISESRGRRSAALTSTLIMLVSANGSYSYLSMAEAVAARISPEIKQARLVRVGRKPSSAGCTDFVDIPWGNNVVDEF